MADTNNEGGGGRERPGGHGNGRGKDRSKDRSKDRGGDRGGRSGDRGAPRGKRPAGAPQGRDGERKPFGARDASKPQRERGDRGEGDRGDRSDRGDRPQRSGSGRGGKPRGEGGGRSGPREWNGDRPRSDRPRPDRSDRSRSDRPPSDRPRVDRRRTDPPPADGTEETGERIAKRLARAGIASRRDAERMIEAGRVSLNGASVETPATLVTPSDVIAVDGTPVPAPERTRLWLLHKPAGLVTTDRDPEGRPTVFDALPDDLPRVVSVGRLDINTEGLLLLTNDGGLARVLELPSTGWLRRYRVRAHGRVRQSELDELRHGMNVDGTFYGAIEATLEREQGSNMWLTLALREGKNREVKNVLGALGLDVNRLIRTSYGPFQLGELEPGAVREIRGRSLRDQLGPRLIEEAGADFESDVRPADRRPGRPPRDRREEREDDKPRTPRKRGEWVSASASPFERPKGKPFGREKVKDTVDDPNAPPPAPERERDRHADRQDREARGLRGKSPVRRVFDEDGRPYRVREERPDDSRPERRSPDTKKSHTWRSPEAREAEAPRGKAGKMDRTDGRERPAREARGERRPAPLKRAADPNQRVRQGQDDAPRPGKREREAGERERETGDGRPPRGRVDRPRDDRADRNGSPRRGGDRPARREDRGDRRKDRSDRREDRDGPRSPRTREDRPRGERSGKPPRPPGSRTRATGPRGNGPPRGAGKGPRRGPAPDRGPADERD